MKTKLLVHYDFNAGSELGKDLSGNEFHAVTKGSVLPKSEMVHGKQAVTFAGGANGTSYLELPSSIFSGISDENGISISTWVYVAKNGGVWERILDFGKGTQGPYLFLTRNLRLVCFLGQDLFADPYTVLNQGEWYHVAVTVSGTQGGKLSSAGPKVYLNGELIADGSISQTTSGLYKKLKEWFATFEDLSNYEHCYLGRSQFDADIDFSGSLADFKIYEGVLSESEIMEDMCNSYSDEELVSLAMRKYLKEPDELIVRNIELPLEFLKGKVSVSWSSDQPAVISEYGVLGSFETPTKVTLTATLRKGEACETKAFVVTAIPESVIPYSIDILGNQVTTPVSDTLWGLFYEDINNAADGGIYAEQIQNRSFENFKFAVYDGSSGIHGASKGRVRNPLEYWFGDLDKCTPCFENGLNQQLGITKEDTNNCYIHVEDGTQLINRGFCDTNHALSIVLSKDAKFDFSIWARAAKEGKIKVYLRNEAQETVSNCVEFVINHSCEFIKYGVEPKLVLTADTACHAELVMEFTGEMDIDFVSLMPEDVWGALEEMDSESAHKNFRGNPNYRLRKDLVKALKALHPSFLRFPGGCISEGSYIWENVYDWKDSVGPVETRKENFNVWGYCMTMGLGYMEYFQLAEDLGATPLPVMACGVLCQARSDYANPAGGALQEKYIENFIDLIDFALSTDFEHNIWAKVRKEMGHEAPFDLHLLGVGNENWGSEFQASFEVFYDRIMSYVKENYPGYPFTVISTVGAQADDDAYRYGWRFLSGHNSGTTMVEFTDGTNSIPKEITWYEKKAHYMDTIADEHFYRPNQYLYENADRYEFYARSYREDGTIDDDNSSKVFVGEYASSDKNTLAGAVAEACVMTGFENNTDVVRLAATAPLFNKVLTDGQYRWTPDCIWFDNDSVWYTPTYYVQQLFAKYLGKEVLATEFTTFEGTNRVVKRPHGGISVSTRNAEIAVYKILVIGKNEQIYFSADFKDGCISLLQDGQLNTYSIEEGLKYVSFLHNGECVSLNPFHIDSKNGLFLPASSEGENGIYVPDESFEQYKVLVNAVKISGEEGFFIGAGITSITGKKKNMLQYAVALNGVTTGLRVYKNGVEAYTLGDFSSSTCAGNLRDSLYQPLENGMEYEICFDYGYSAKKEYRCQFCTKDFESYPVTGRLLPFVREVYHSVTKDEHHIYVKLVNADENEKKVALSVKDLTVSSEAMTVTVGCEDPEKAHIANINTKFEEPVKPIEKKVTASNGQFQLTLQPQSVTCLILDI